MNKKKNTLVLNTSEQAGGAARAAWRILESTALCGYHMQELVKKRESENIKVIDLEAFRPKNCWFRLADWMGTKLKNRYYRLLWHPYAKRQGFFLSDLRSTRFFGALDKLDYNLLHLHWVNLRFLDLKLLKKVKRPIVWTLHDCWPFTGVCHLFYECGGYCHECGCCPMLNSLNHNDLSHVIWQTKRTIYRGLDLHIVAPSRWMEQVAKQSSLFKNVSVCCIPNPIDTDLFRPGEIDVTVLPFTIDATKRYIVFGAMNALHDKNKGYDLLCQSLVKLSRTDDLVLIVYGDSVGDSVEINHIPIINVGLIQDDVVLISLLRLAEVVAVPSLSESFGYSAVEAMACATPVVAFDVTGLKDIVDHKENGFLASPYDTDEFARGLSWVLSETVQHDNLQRSARNKVVQTFSYSVVGKQYTALYDKLIGI